MTIEERMKLRESDPTTKTQDVTIYFPYTTKTVKVDTLIASCIQVLNDAGFWTSFSCSGHEADCFTDGYVKFEQSALPWEDLIDILNNIPEFIIERKIRFVTRYNECICTMTNPSDEQMDAFKQYMYDFWKDSLHSTKSIIIRMYHHDCRSSEFRDINLELTKTAFRKLEDAVREYVKKQSKEEP